jgi:hypothetical protein
LEVLASSDALQQGAQQHSASKVSEAVQQPQRAQRAPAATACTSSHQVKTPAQPKKAGSVGGIFVACKDGWSEDIPKCRWQPLAAKEATKSLHDMCSKTTLDSLERSNASQPLQQLEAPSELCGPTRQEKSSKAAAQQICASSTFCWCSAAASKASARAHEPPPEEQAPGSAASSRSRGGCSVTCWAAVHPAAKRRGFGKGGSLPAA